MPEFQGLADALAEAPQVPICGGFTTSCTFSPTFCAKISHALGMSHTGGQGLENTALNPTFFFELNTPRCSVEALGAIWQGARARAMPPEASRADCSVDVFWLQKIVRMHWSELKGSVDLEPLHQVAGIGTRVRLLLDHGSRVRQHEVGEGFILSRVDRREVSHWLHRDVLALLDDATEVELVRPAINPQASWVHNVMLAALPCELYMHDITTELPPNATSALLVVDACGREDLDLILSAAVQLRGRGVRLGLAHTGDADLHCARKIEYGDFDYVFRNFNAPEFLDRPLVTWLPLGSFGGGSDGGSFKMEADVMSAIERPILCSFVGDAFSVDSHTMLQYLRHPCVISTTAQYRDPIKWPAGMLRAVRDTLGNSAVTLCPAGLHEETHAFWEALEVGSIPLIKRNNSAWASLGKHPLPMVEHWSEVNHALADLFDPAKLLQRQRIVMHWWRNEKKQHAFRMATAIEPTLPPLPLPG